MIVVAGICAERKENIMFPFQESKKEGPGNNRQVSLTPAPGNVVEKVDPEKHLRQIEEEEMIRGRAWLHQGEVMLDELDKAL